MSIVYDLQRFTPQANKTRDKAQNLYHIFEDDDIAALWAAYAAGRPLLVRGEPGTGKSQMAKAIASHLGWAFVSKVICGDTELSDLHYSFDAVARLGQAQVLGSAGADRNSLDPLNFLSPGPFWWAYEWASAKIQHGECTTTTSACPSIPDSKIDVPQGVVLLIDEIDKANPDLPNGLLETIGEREFSVPYLPSKKEKNKPSNPIKAGSLPLLIVITTNEERELPTAFVRRCFVHTLKINDDDSEAGTRTVGEDKARTFSVREEWLVKRGEFRFGGDLSEEAYYEAAKLLWKDRQQGHRDTRYKPGLAEYIDLLTVLEKVPKSEQAAFIDTIAGYALKKELAG